MAPWLIIVIGGVYLWIAADLWWHGQGWMGLTFVGYALGNLGLAMAAKGTA